MIRPRNTPARIFAWPLAVAATTVVGLTAGLVGEGGWDWVAWFGLAVPVALAAAGLRGRTSGAK